MLMSNCEKCKCDADKLNELFTSFNYLVQLFSPTMASEWYHKPTGKFPCYSMKKIYMSPDYAISFILPIHSPIIIKCLVIVSNFITYCPLYDSL